MKTEKTRGGFMVGPTSIIGHSVVQWDFDEQGSPRRSLQVETEIAEIWAAAFNSATEVEDMGFDGLEAIRALGELLRHFEQLRYIEPRWDADYNKIKKARALLERLKGGSDEA